eukprot:TRINITY_DN11023_c0_g2_i1.p1 TRINITY_DN11023_c0_g2~~TRINITY_DN11023_c0_g2_i1.p1  ORF type:complete len:183 (+),score=19.18 TRINITY_DN11023_c0_g2_i1:34-582(+)
MWNNQYQSPRYNNRRGSRTNYNNDYRDEYERHPNGLVTCTQANGYSKYWDTREDKWTYTHRRVAEKKIGRPVMPDEEVHHINKDRGDNRYENLVVLSKPVHKVLHQSPEHERTTCFRCGRQSHWAEDCYAHTDFQGDRIDPPSPSPSPSPSYTPSGCYRCGRDSHWAQDCYATRDINGNYIQ